MQKSRKCPPRHKLGYALGSNPSMPTIDGFCDTLKSPGRKSEST